MEVARRLARRPAKVLVQDAFLSARSLRCGASVLKRNPCESLLLVNTALVHHPDNPLRGATRHNSNRDHPLTAVGTTLRTLAGTL